MPVPKTKSVAKLREWFKKDKPNWPAKQVEAAALNTARRNGASIPAPKKKTKSKSKRSK